MHALVVSALAALDVACAMRLAAYQMPGHTCSPQGVEQERPANESGNAGDFPVDAVYTWVAQPTEDEFRKIAATCNQTMTGGMQRFRNLGTFRFSLRMLELNIPWIRNVFLVTNGEIPGWIDTSNPKLKLIQHSDIWPADLAERVLPVFNSQAIEVYLHRIPGLSERFIYFNDDMFVGRPLEKSFFFTDDGKPMQYSSVTKIKQWCQAPFPYAPAKIEHMPYVLSLSMIREIQARWPSHFMQIGKARCRGEVSVDWGPAFHYGWYAIQSDQGAMKAGRFAWLNDLNVNHMEEWYHEQLSNPPDLGCINDDFEIADAAKFERQQRMLLEFMNNMSKHKRSSFEKDGEQEQKYALRYLPRYSNNTLIRIPSLLIDDAVRYNRSNISAQAPRPGSSPAYPHVMNETQHNDTLSAPEHTLH